MSLTARPSGADELKPASKSSSGLEQDLLAAISDSGVQPCQLLHGLAPADRFLPLAAQTLH
ncbi:hypothetical protein EM20IM_03410 [Candidatus Methylacidiphilum infernorum]|uniref:Uncharacterized protein n=1 Tax=Candidatus Methylacidiphilum infernorum TaxID=511746 RepID=A0ABX7PXD7_9BACT|nr:hypothetical protein [Candidatus Methylacidiphilum infernorum]QSR87388.1 hypothetical protein EM20IM_03410 [Candidatus Methylacidiphilum infernorum]